MEEKLIKRITLIVVTLAGFLAPFDGSSVNVALPSIGKEFSMGAISLSWVATAYLLTSAMFLVPFGKIADIYGRKRIFVIGILVFTMASFSMILSRSTMLLICFRIFQGIGSAMIFSTSLALLISIYPAEERGKALGITIAATYMGLSLGPLLGGFLIKHFGWRSIFLVNIPVGLAIIAFVSLKLKGEWAESKGEKFDLIGSIIYCLSIIAMMYGFSSFSQLGPVISSCLIILGALGILIFIRWETGSGSPLLNINLFRNSRVFLLSNLAALINYCATYAITFFLSLYLQYIKNLNPLNAGLVLTFQPIVMAISSPFAGRLSDKFEPRIVASLGMGLTAAGLFLLAFLKPDTSLDFIIVVLIFIGLGFALFASPNTNAVMSSVEKKFYGVASGTLATMRLTGQMFGMGIAMMIFSIHIGHAQINPGHYSGFLMSMKSAFLFFGFLCSGGILASLERGKVHDQ